MNLIPQWQQLWKMYSVQLAGLLTLLNTAAYFWPSFQMFVGPELFAAVNGLLAAGVAVVRAIQQPVLTAPVATPTA
ncbi:hypothetical protein [Pseudomonas sp. FW300-N2A2]|uniref:DUF7940 domain-containing protein n=1 Tax=Pseudomonas sp. FW300-N2A2 TaxID=2751316 RepID=UPI001A92E457|nr:hypothetical protein [Pseudomonas sp. FW300-N2A2]